ILSQLPRVRDAVVGDSKAPIAVSLVFEEDAQRRVMISGCVETELMLECQRCLQPVRSLVSATVAGMVVVTDDAAAMVPRSQEPVMAEGESLDLHELVEDEILLALPMTVQCDRPAC